MDGNSFCLERAPDALSPRGTQSTQVCKAEDRALTLTADLLLPHSVQGPESPVVSRQEFWLTSRSLYLLPVEPKVPGLLCLAFTVPCLLLHPSWVRAVSALSFASFPTSHLILPPLPISLLLPTWERGAHPWESRGVPPRVPADTLHGTVSLPVDS